MLNFGNVIPIDAVKWLKKITTKATNACYSMALHSSMPSCKRDLMRDMLTLAECSELESILLNIRPRVINTFMELEEELDVHNIRIGLAICAIGNLHMFYWTEQSLLNNKIFFSDIYYCVGWLWENLFCNSMP